MSTVPTRQQVSAGGVAFRRREGEIQVAIIVVESGDDDRWQLPKGMIEEDETREETALREVREETGLDTELVGFIDKIEYWYYGRDAEDQRVRYHKFVYFYLLRYRSGTTDQHDDEVETARWVDIARAEERLAFENERKIVRKARDLIVSDS